MVIAEVRCRGMILNLLRVPRGDNFEVIGAARDCRRARCRAIGALHDGERRAYLPSWPGSTFSPGPFLAGGPIKRSLRVTI
jgi:hypothetical protein